MNKKLIRKILFLSARIIATALILVLGFMLLNKYDYINNLRYVDNLVGFLPILIVLLVQGGLISITWLVHLRLNKSKIVICSILSFWTILSGALFPNALVGNWVKGTEVKDIGHDGDISIYEPFIEGSKAVKLEETSTLTLNSDLPVLDGALALYPVYSAVGQATYNQAAYTDEIRFTNTIRGFNSLVSGDVDIFFSAYPSALQMEHAKNNNVDLHFTPIGKEAFVFIVPKSNPIDNITYQQIKNIYTGKTSFWRTLGWKEGGEMIKFQRPEGSGSQSSLQNILKGLPLQKPQPLPDKSLIGTNSLMDNLTITYKGVQPALGYSFKFFATEMNPNEDTKFLSINGVSPTDENIQNGSYIFATKFYAITRGEPSGNIKLLLDWMLTEQGQYIISKTGYSKI
ncbi:MAG: substrate-binding domain-containing protein [Bacilli bacterium]|nr:substrate-binding domain-containing protein [Bacilli bacterium]